MEMSKLQSEIDEFAEERDWEQFHTVKNLILALVGEVGELAEIVQWKTDLEIETELSPAEFEEALINLDGELDRIAAGWHRKEQAMGRRRLLKGKPDGTCQICGREMNSEFLIAAHIKRRSECEDHEKRDLDGVMMLACKFGCDYLFEVGMIAVKSGKLLVSPSLKDKVASEYASMIEDRTIQVLEKQAKYFDWHFSKRFIKK